MAIKEIEYKHKIFKLSYEICNPNAKMGILILHGWGSNKEIMKQAFDKKFQEYRVTYLDLPGFGGSSNEMILHTVDYSFIVKLFIKAVGLNPTIIIGHSFGGKVATLLNPKHLVLLSSAGIVTVKPWSVKIKIATFKFLKPLGIKRIRELFVAPDAQGMSHEMYETFKNVVDEDFEDVFRASLSSQIHDGALIVHNQRIRFPVAATVGVMIREPRFELGPRGNLTGDHDTPDPPT